MSRGLMVDMLKIAVAMLNSAEKEAYLPTPNRFRAIFADGSDILFHEYSEISPIPGFRNFVLRGGSIGDRFLVVPYEGTHIEPLLPQETTP